MIVCVCRGLGESAIRSAIAAGAGSAREIGARCGAGTACGGCCRMLEDLIAEARGRCRGGSGAA